MKHGSMRDHLDDEYNHGLEKVLSDVRLLTRLTKVDVTLEDVEFLVKMAKRPRGD